MLAPSGPVRRARTRTPWRSAQGPWLQIAARGATHATHVGGCCREEDALQEAGWEEEVLVAWMDGVEQVIEHSEVQLHAMEVGLRRRQVAFPERAEMPHGKRPRSTWHDLDDSPQQGAKQPYKAGRVNVAVPQQKWVACVLGRSLQLFNKPKWP